MRDSSSASLDRIGWPARIVLRLHVEALALAIPALALAIPIRRLLAIFTPRSVLPIYAPFAASEIAGVVKQRLRRPWAMRTTRCLREGLMTFYLMRRAGIPAVLHICVYPFDGRRNRAHCWVAVTGACVTTSPVAPFATILTYPALESR
jgi:transglutaminase superfamily protein